MERGLPLEEHHIVVGTNEKPLFLLSAILCPKPWRNETSHSGLSHIFLCQQDGVLKDCDQQCQMLLSIPVLTAALTHLSPASCGNLWGKLKPFLSHDWGGSHIEMGLRLSHSGKSGAAAISITLSRNDKFNIGKSLEGSVGESILLF